ncbi:MAG: 50S ribosomal protein L35 [Parcubacteria group bacterium]|nr:50S ribosomal protein L35 [Parcubacteria group bacterium]
MKTNKSFKKRVKVTKNGKVIARTPGHNHFNAKESRSKQLDRKNSQEVQMSTKDKSRFLANL